MIDHAPSMWIDRLGPIVSRPSLDHDVDADVVIVGAGFTGLWTAYHLARLFPSARVVVIEAAKVGFGASSRNGGWCMGALAASHARWVSIAGRRDADRMEEAIVDTVDEIESTLRTEHIACDFARNGTLILARNPAQEKRLRKEVGPGRVWLDSDEAEALCPATNVRGGLHTVGDAILDPARLVMGLAERCERAGVAIYENSRAAAISQGMVRTDGGVVTAGSIVIATEGYTVDLPNRHRDLAPFYARMIATEPLPSDIAQRVGMERRIGFADGRYRVIYGQRTADGRIAFGAAAATYSYGSRIDPSFETEEESMRQVHQILVELFPVLADTRITHRWGGVIGVPRNWVPTVTFDDSTGIHRAGGYVGDGVAASNLAGRCLAHLICGTGDEVTTLPWVRRPSRRWPIEPFRWMGITAGSAVLESADRGEARNGRPSRRASLIWNTLRR